jgi:outer membrane lipoprotein SlyB
MRITRFAQAAVGAALVASLGACVYAPPRYAPVANYPATYPAGTYPAPAYGNTTVAPMPTEYGRVTNIQVFQTTGAARTQNVPGAILGAVAGAAIGHGVGAAIGGTRARDTATVLGGVAGLGIGSQVGTGPVAGAPVYRVTVQTDQGVMRFFDVPSPGDLRIGDRVRIDQGVIYHY